MVHRGFTLIEMLVVIAIIGILAGITIVGYGAVMRDINIRKARADCAMLGAACRMYHAHVHEWPLGADQVEIIHLRLMSPIETTDLGRPPVLDGLKESQLDTDGYFMDPWKSPYVIEFPDEGVLIYSFGPDAQSDWGHFEGDGCAAADHASLTPPVDDVRP